MRLLIGLLLLLCTAGVWAEQQYYHADPARLAQLEAERCHRIRKESALIRRRLTRPVARRGDVIKMKRRLQTLDASAVKYCPTVDEKHQPAGSER